jgi:hypothetical protein
MKNKRFIIWAANINVEWTSDILFFSIKIYATYDALLIKEPRAVPNWGSNSDLIGFKSKILVFVRVGSKNEDSTALFDL